MAPSQRILLKTLFFIIISSSLSAADPRGIERTALLQFKTSVQDPTGVLQSWSSTASNHCSWPFVSCNARSRVTSLNISVSCSKLGPFGAACTDPTPRLAGTLSPAIGHLTELRFLSLPFHKFQGEIPTEIWRLGNLQFIDLSDNLLNGTLPSYFPPNLRVLNLAGNSIKGEIPVSISNCTNLESLDLSRNQFNGSIPPYLANLNGLKYLSLAQNNLTGTIPSALYQLKSLETLDLSSNSLTGTIPNNSLILKILLLNNNKLSENTPQNPLNSNRRYLTVSIKDSSSQLDPSSPSPTGGNFSSLEIASITSASAIVSVLLALVILYIYTRKCHTRNNSSSEPSRRSNRRLQVTPFVDLGVPITYESVVRSTGNFNASNCIGSGGFGATYKAEIAPGILVAIKRLSIGRFQGIEQFQAEIKTLGRCKHSNLVTLIGYHLGDSETFLIYNYLPGGNLEKFIQERVTKNQINWRQLHKISLDIAQALAFLHDSCVPRILHRDVKPSNILLDNDYNAYLSDFGLARLLGNSETHATTGVAGTFGYVAPEYAMTCRVSDKADVYSYGVVLLELISDKKALDPSFSPYGNGFNIVAWALMLLEKGRAKEFFIEGLWEKAPHDDLVEILHLGIKCTGESLTMRPSMKHVVSRLKELRPPNF